MPVPAGEKQLINFWVVLSQQVKKQGAEYYQNFNQQPGCFSVINADQRGNVVLSKCYLQCLIGRVVCDVFNRHC